MSEEMFKTTLMGGFDKDEVMERIQKMKDEAAEQQLKWKKQIEEKEDRITELQKRLELREAHQARLESEIQEKYQKYIDNYESIGRLVFEAQVKADAMIKEAQEKCDAMIAEAEEEARQRVESVQSEIDDKLLEGKKKYVAVQEEMNEIVQLINQAQRRFMASYKEVHQIISTMPSSLNDIEEEGEHLVKFLAATLSGQTLCLEMEVNVLSEEDYAAYIKKKNTQTYSSNADSVCIANSGGDAMSIAQCFVGLSGWCTTIAQNFINAYLGSGYNIYDTYDISYSEAQPGDIIYYVNGGWGMQHYAVYLGNDTALQGNMSGGLAKIGSIYLTYGSEPIFKRLNGR